MLVQRAAFAAAIFVASAAAAPVWAQGEAYPGFGPGFDTGDLAPGYELPGQYPASPEREQVTPYGQEPEAGAGEQDTPINVVGGQTETFERGIIGDALNRGKSSVIGAFKKEPQPE